ncbi:MAG TPA: DMT family transporter [Rubrivivax sp.]|nr:DMT family transporter [Rubrivivax sp.]
MTAGTAAAGAGPVAALLFNAFVWGVSWWPLRWLQAQGLHPLWATMLIFLLAAALITLARPGSWAQLARTPPLWVLVIASGTTNAAFNWGVTIGDVVRVVLLFYLMPLWAVLLARLLLGERLSAAAAVRVALALAGAALVLRPEGGGWPLPHTLGDALGLAGGFTFALNNVLLRRQAHQPQAARALAMFVGGAVVSALLALALQRQAWVPPLPAPAAPWLAGACGMGLLFLASNLALQYGAARLAASVTAVVMVSEVLFASVSAVALGAAQPSVALAGGGALIVGAALLAVLRR